jgi:branched-chain amino acid aminotransferase
MSFPGTGKIWMNGKLVEWKDATIHIGSHIVHYGSGVFEGARCYDTTSGPACFRLDAHLRRLFDSARIYRMDVTYSAQELTDAVHETITANGFRACYIRPIVYRGYDSLGVNPFPCPVDTRKASTSRSRPGRAMRRTRRPAWRRASRITRTHSSSRWKRSPTATPRRSRSIRAAT